jgi:phosphoglycerate dehydrogenase-like enzyme
LNFCGAAEFSAMKQSGVFVSLGRGAVVDEAALLAALTANTIRGAALDVFATEPLPEASPLWRLPKEKIYITSHNADLTDDYFSLGWDVWAQNHAAKRKGATADNAASSWEPVTPFDPARGY